MVAEVTDDRKDRLGTGVDRRLLAVMEAEHEVTPPKEMSLRQ
jgi:hypothetical protein